MALVVEDGSGVPNANCYISSADADDYHASRGNAAWDNAADEDKEAAILRATDYLQGVYAGQWKGWPSTAHQALDWPRAYIPRLEYAALTSQTFWYDDDVIPDAVKHACAELALRSLSSPISPDLGRTRSRETVGPLTVEYVPGARENKAYQVVQGLLSRYLKNAADGMVPLVRT